MNAVDRTKAGVASGTLSMTRMVGGTFGVAALGALVASVGRHDLAQSLPRVPEATREKLVDALGSGAATTGAPDAVRAGERARVRGRARRRADDRGDRHRAGGARGLVHDRSGPARSMRRRPRRPSPRLRWSSAVHVLTEVDPELIARLREERPLLLDRPRRAGAGRGPAARRGARPAPGRARGHARDGPAAEDRALPGPRPARLLHARAAARPSRSRSTSTSRATSSPPCTASRATRSTTCTRRSPSEPTHDEEMLVYRVLDGLTDAYYPVIAALEDRDRRARGRGPRAPAARAPDPQLPAQAGRARAAPARRRPARAVQDRARGRSSASRA